MKECRRSDSPQQWSVRAGYNARSQRGDLESVKDLIDPFHGVTTSTSPLLSLSSCCRAESGLLQPTPSGDSQSCTTNGRERRSVSDSLSHKFTSHWGVIHKQPNQRKQMLHCVINVFVPNFHTFFGAGCHHCDLATVLTFVHVCVVILDCCLFGFFFCLWTLILSFFFYAWVAVCASRIQHLPLHWLQPKPYGCLSTFHPKMILFCFCLFFHLLFFFFA